MKIKSFADRRRGLGKLVGTMVVLAALAGIVATVAFGKSQPQVTLHVSQVGKIGHSGSTLAIRGSVVCKAGRFFALGAEAVELSTGASVHGSVPLSGKHAPSCASPRKSFTIAATQKGQAKPRAPTPGTYRACFFIHSWAQHGAVTLDARCFTLHGSRS